MENEAKQVLKDQIVARVGREGASAVFELIGLGDKTDRQPLEGPYRVVLVDEGAALPECPFLEQAKSLEKRFRDEADQGSVQETHAVYDRLKMAECRCDGWAHACAAVAGAGYARVVEPGL